MLTTQNSAQDLLPPVRRVVTGTDASGKAVVVSDGPAPVVISNFSGYRIVEMWATDRTPPDLSGADISDLPFELEPPAGGLHWRLINWPVSEQQGRWHSTDTLDLLYILTGEISLGVGSEDESVEVHLKAGDAVVALGNVHKWFNPGPDVCSAVATMVSALPLD